MVLKWRPLANEQLKEIISYYRKVASSRVAKNIAGEIFDTADRLHAFPYLGAIEQNMEGLPYVFRSIVAYKHYKIIYFIDVDTIHIFAIWDVRQNPQRMRNL